MKLRPILFSGEMVRAILDGRKTQTRRVVKPQPPCGCEYVINGAHDHALCRSVDHPGLWVPPTAKSIDHRLPCPYGRPGDRLTVKETHALVKFSDEDITEWRGRMPKSLPDGGWQIVYRSGDAAFGAFDEDGLDRGFRWRPSIFMPRWASRLTLEIARVRVERLQDISEADAMAEGINCYHFYPDDGFPICEGYTHKKDDGKCVLHPTAKAAYMEIWESINGPGSWDANPWVWVVEFKRVTP